MAPFRYDIVGSFLRPQILKKAREQFNEEKISLAQLQEVEDECIKDLVDKEKSIGLKAITDGEFRRAFWHLDFLAELDGITKVKAKAWSVAFKDHQPKAETIKITGKIDFPENHPFVEHFKFLQAQADDKHMAKLTIPSPSMLHLITCVRAEQYTPIDIYEQDSSLYSDIAAAYKKAVKIFYDLGCRYLQLDDTSWGEFCSAEKRDAYAERGFDLDAIAEAYVSVINEIINDKPADMTITMHICRGNFQSTWFSSGGYEPVAEVLFGGCHVDGFFLEYDSERAGDFSPLRFIREQKVVLGLITSKTPELESADAVKARIEEAQAFVPLKQLCLSPQCGFASTEEGNLLTEKEQWAKIALIKRIAEEVWRDAE
ncbi:5-methyltetrahydropteroyltriglutamate--homocysteine S-methyltransferase [Pectinatus haikarae]|uniref:5-methyltetrahydropteroyltriglutamate--homocysteine methyltransferase n=1 Tax=Pectinatus haikarae TaxID=349096 RepID=A0ABT9Y570_9FIRM|nr:5-methyltetrahydropteroyltriglutamate--homocysteine S-methyltransferase [Pectinatus haikarae]MDQ0202972.1 5-methyltetrahydropteroyltriglutamate--homocysteine methyltransferase [Pectinatus haikarae]